MYRYKKLFYLFYFLILVLLDQFSKYIIRLKGGFYICNQNLAFGIKFSEIIYFLLFLILLLIIWKIFENFKFQNRNSKSSPELKSSKNIYNKLGFWILDLFRISDLEFRIFPILLILSGGLSNIIDRIYFGCVIDFININNIISWPIFNLADIFITIGVVFLIFYNFKSNKLKAKS